MLKSKDKKEEIKDKIEKLRLELHKEYEIYGHSERVIKKSQKLDQYIFMMQQELMKSKLKK